MVQTSPYKVENGGFPEPPMSSAVRLVAARHDRCGEATRVRLIAAIPAASVRRMHCERCDCDFSPERVDDLGTVTPQTAAATLKPANAAAAVAKPAVARPAVANPTVAKPAPQVAPPRSTRRFSIPKPSLPGLNPQGRIWRLASIPVAAIAVLGGLALLQGGGDDSPPTRAVDSAATVEAPAAAASDGGRAEPRAGAGKDSDSKAAKNTKLVRGSSYSLALPAGWERIAASGGATFAAVAPDGVADATLWIEEDPKLDFPTFISQSLAQLEALAGSARIVERFPAPTPEDTIIRLAADAPAGQPSYEVTLRVAGAFRYYLATSVQPDAAPEAAEGAELIAGSFTPELGS